MYSCAHDIFDVAVLYKYCIVLYCVLISPSFPLVCLFLLLCTKDAKCSLCVGLISLAVVAALVLEKLVSGPEKSCRK